MFACYTAKIDEFEADMDAISYIRFSDPKQEKGHSQRTSYDRFADYVRHRHGFAGHHRFIDR